jgi:exopolyphosphatase/guanosine-5'-triphosphate,3'-diphosphate pyrophosphatase
MEKVAVIQLDSVALRLLLVDVEGAYYKIYDEVVEVLKLGDEISQDGMISIASVTQTLRLLKMFRKVCDVNKVSKSYSIATDVFKDAKNEKSFFEEVYNNTGFNFNILSQDEIAKAVYAGVVNVMDEPKGFVLNVDFNRSTIINYNRRNILKITELPIGALNLAVKYENFEGNNAKKIKEMTAEVLEYLNQNVEKTDMLPEQEISFIGSGESFLNLGKLARRALRYPLELENNYQVTTQTIDNVANFVSTLDIDKTMRLKGISPFRADMLASGTAIISALSQFYQFEGLKISSGGLREGIIFNYLVPQVSDKPLSEMLNYSLETINTFYDNGSKSDNHFYHLTLILFKQIKVLHKLPRYYVKPLKIATYLSDSGKRINFDDYIQASFNVILNSKIYSATQKEILIAAFASLCQNQDSLNLSDWVKYKDILSEEDLDAVRKIGMIIKLARALDKSKNEVVEDINCDVLGDSVILKTIVKGDASFEILLANKIAPEFKKVFNKKLQVI